MNHDPVATQETGEIVSLLRLTEQYLSTKDNKQ